MSWHGPSAPRVEGIATKSRVVLSWASKPASTASRIRWASLAVMMVIVPRVARSNHTLRQLCRRSVFHGIPTLRNWKNRRMPLPMEIISRAVLCCLLLLGAMTPALALNNQVGREQDVVGLRLGQRVMVDDGSCPQGQIKEV